MSAAQSVTIRVPPEVIEKLDRLAQKEQRSRSNLVLLLVRQGLEKQEGK